MVAADTFVTIAVQDLKIRHASFWLISLIHFMCALLVILLPSTIVFLASCNLLPATISYFIIEGRSGESSAIMLKKFFLMP